MITFGLNYDVKDEFIPEFKRISLSAIELMQSMEGHVNTVLYNDVQKPHAFLIYSEWEKEEQFRDFIQSEPFKNVQNMTRDMLFNRPRHKVYETKKMGGPQH